MAKWIIEIFNEAEKSANPVQVLIDNRTQPMDQFIDMMKAGVKWDLPEGSPPFKRLNELPLGNAELSLYNAIRRFYVFDVRSNASMLKKEQIFIQMLEALHPTEADLVIALKDGKIPTLYPNLWKAVGGKPVVTEPEPVAETPKPVKKALYNDGKVAKMFVIGEEPEGWVRGRLK